MGFSPASAGPLTSAQSLPGVPSRKITRKKSKLHQETAKPSAETLQTATSSGTSRRTSPFFRLYFQRLKRGSTPDSNIVAIRSTSFEPSSNIVDADSSAPSSHVMLRTKSLVRRTKSMVRRTKSLVKRKLAIVPANQRLSAVETLQGNASPPSSISLAGTQKDITFGPKILKSSPMSNPKKSSIAFYHLFSHFGQIGSVSPPDSRHTSFAFSKSFSFADSQQGAAICLENSTDFQTLESPAPEESSDRFGKEVFAGSYHSKMKDLHPAVSRAFRFEISEKHKAENTRLTGIESRRHMAPFQCKKNPDELLVTISSLSLDEERIRGHQAIVTKNGASGTLMFYTLSDEPEELDQNL